MKLGVPPRGLAAIAFASCALALAGCAAQTTSEPASASASAPSSSASAPASSAAAAPASSAASFCRDSQVAISLTHTGAAAGTVGGYLTFTNRGATTCKLTGWPIVSAITGTGKREVVAHAANTMIGGWQYTTPMPVLRLAPGHSGYAVLQSNDVAVGNATSCPPPYTRLQVSIPGGATPTTLSAWLPGAGTYLPGCLSISGSPVVRISDINSSSILP